LGLERSLGGDALLRKNNTERVEPFRGKGFPAMKN
jgi:hypothetical protein